MEKLLTQAHPLKRLMPAWLKRVARSALLSHTFGQAVREIKALPSGVPPTLEVLRRLRIGWDNSGWDGKLGYLEEIAERAVRTPGPILECGSGLTTIVLGLLAGARGVETWSLEHHHDWRRRVNDALDRYGVQNVNVCLAPLRDYDGFNWYDPPLHRLPEEFSLVICDGPPDIENCGRYGLLPILSSRLSANAVIVFDDAKEPGQDEVLKRWQVESGATVEMRETPEVDYALVTCR